MNKAPIMMALGVIKLMRSSPVTEHKEVTVTQPEDKVSSIMDNAPKIASGLLMPPERSKK